MKVKLGCKSAMWQVCDGTEMRVCLCAWKCGIRSLLEHSKAMGKAILACLETWWRMFAYLDKTSYFRINVNSVLAGNVFELQP